MIDCKDLIKALLRKEISVDEADKLLKAGKVSFQEAKYYYTRCFFCCNRAFGSKTIVLCSNCGVSPSNYFEEYLLRYGVNAEMIRHEFADRRKELVELIIKHRQQLVAKAIAYNYHKTRDYRKAMELIPRMRESRRKFRNVVDLLFGKNVCMNDCIINLFIEKAEDCDIDAEKILEGINILRRLGKKMALTKGIVAAVFI
jgi:hypothetical protein